MSWSITSPSQVMVTVPSPPVKSKVLSWTSCAHQKWTPGRPIAAPSWIDRLVPSARTPEAASSIHRLFSAATFAEILKVGRDCRVPEPGVGVRGSDGGALQGVARPEVDGGRLNGHLDAGVDQPAAAAHQGRHGRALEAEGAGEILGVVVGVDPVVVRALHGHLVLQGLAQRPLEFPGRGAAVDLLEDPVAPPLVDRQQVARDVRRMPRPDPCDRRAVHDWHSQRRARDDGRCRDHRRIGDHEGVPGRGHVGAASVGRPSAVGHAHGRAASASREVRDRDRVHRSHVLQAAAEEAPDLTEEARAGRAWTAGLELQRPARLAESTRREGSLEPAHRPAGDLVFGTLDLAGQHLGAAEDLPEVADHAVTVEGDREHAVHVHEVGDQLEHRLGRVLDLAAPDVGAAGVGAPVPVVVGFAGRVMRDGLEGDGRSARVLHDVRRGHGDQLEHVRDLGARRPEVAEAGSGRVGVLDHLALEAEVGRARGVRGRDAADDRPDDRAVAARQRTEGRGDDAPARHRVSSERTSSRGREGDRLAAGDRGAERRRVRLDLVDDRNAREGCLAVTHGRISRYSTWSSIASAWIATNP